MPCSCITISTSITYGTVPCVTLQTVFSYCTVSTYTRYNCEFENQAFTNDPLPIQIGQENFMELFKYKFQGGWFIKFKIQYQLRAWLLFSLLLVFRKAEVSAKRVTGDEPQGTMGREQTAGISPVVSFPPSFARTFSSKERRLGTRQAFAGVGPASLWNTLPSAIRSIQSVQGFKRVLKTFLFRLAFAQ